MKAMLWAIGIVGTSGTVCFAQQLNFLAHYYSEPYSVDPLLVVLGIWESIILWCIFGAIVLTRACLWAFSKSNNSAFRKFKFATSTRTLQRLAAVTLVANVIGALAAARRSSEILIRVGGAPSLGESQAQILECSHLLLLGVLSFAAAWVLSWVVEAIAGSATPQPVIVTRER